ncbi:AraC family transcriptional regulator (plasmid) [Neorhizobium sp. SOG26]|uniref:helix-turn-helix domain-containing protein n=1 Tax=Neorhizobium sp. SOG26 TaxID=2060726 RepID=UPI000E5729BA|nr:AraC family transcriptional regulator [Neorhizobium sp. SOG26]AXV18334.1 AraC family transcriptional regulator [Neorhizobium sp. SOG26]
MNFWHSMIWHTEGIRPVAPARWRQMDGMVGVYWEAESQAGAKGYYLADDPRIMIFRNDVSSRIRLSNTGGDIQRYYRPMMKALYVPAGVPMWTSSEKGHRFGHLNLHLHKDRLVKYLAPSIGRSAALAAINRPVELQQADAVETLAGLVIDELATPSRHSAYVESLVGSIVTGLLDLTGDQQDQANGRLTQAQMNKLNAYVDARCGQRVSVAEMAAAVGLSESWFSCVFKQTVGKTPLQWQLGKRIELAKTMLRETDLSLAEIANQLRFSDQAHLTKVFRKTAGETPAAWRRKKGLT